MLIKLLSKLFGSKKKRDLAEIMPYVERINKEYERLRLLSHDQLRAETKRLQKFIADTIEPYEKKYQEASKALNDNKVTDPIVLDNLHKNVKAKEDDIDKHLWVILDEVLPTAFAIVKDTGRRLKENEQLIVQATDFDIEVAERADYVKIDGDKAIWFNHWEVMGHTVVWDMIHYDVQLIGGVILHKGKITEMATGEGKTLVATLPLFLNALSKKGVHMVTVNDYLAKRDCYWMRPLFEFHGLSIACIDDTNPNSDERRAAYNADITYGTNSEFGFDYLRDNMSTDYKSLVQRGHQYAIIDEVDSVLIDDARTPLIISGPTEQNNTREYVLLDPYVKNLYEKQRQIINVYLQKAKNLSEDPKNKEAREALFRAYRGLPKYKPLIKFLSEEGIKRILNEMETYYMGDNCRLLPEADKDLFFAIDEITNSVELTDKGIEYITSLQGDKDFFIMPDLAMEVANIMNNPALSEDEKLEKKQELSDKYTIKSERLHIIKQLLKAYSLFTVDVDYVVMDNKVLIVDEQTGRVLDGRRYSDGLHQALEAKERVKIEKPTQIYATITLQNYFRLYHKLAGMTGTAETEAGEFYDIYKLDVNVTPTHKPVIRDDKPDIIFKTARAKFDAVINKIVELSSQGRPVLVGTTSVDVSELLSRMLKLKGIKHQVLNAKYHQQEAEIVSRAGEASAVTIATNMAGRGTDIKLSEEARRAGGLAIIGTERHESRRVDRQLRGRAGRQGDVGSSQFYISFEDNLMLRMIASGPAAKVIDSIKEDEVIQSKMVSKAIENAQKHVEQNNYGFRKHLLEYDDVLNKQREIIYKRRYSYLMHRNSYADTLGLLFYIVKNVLVKVDVDTKHLLYNDMIHSYHDLTGEDFQLTQEECDKNNINDLYITVYHKLVDLYKQKCNQVSEIFRQQYQENIRENEYENYTFKFNNNGNHPLFVTIEDLKSLENNPGEILMRYVESNITVNFIDKRWQQELRIMTELRQTVQTAYYEQKDPLLVYKFESFSNFKEMVNVLNSDIVRYIFGTELCDREIDEDDDDNDDDKGNVVTYLDENDNNKDSNEDKSTFFDEKNDNKDRDEDDKSFDENEAFDLLKSLRQKLSTHIS